MRRSRRSPGSSSADGYRSGPRCYRTGAQPGGVRQRRLPITRSICGACDRDGFYTCASGGLGHGLPAAIGVALARPHEKIIALLGDGSSMYAIQGLWSAAQLALGITFVIVKNERYEALLEFGRHFGLQRTIGTSLPNIDFCALASGQGVKAISVNRRGALDEALCSAFATTAEPTLVEVAVD